MTQRGRRSAASGLTVVTTLPKRPTPPKRLNTAERAIWKATVTSKPVDWFDAGTWPDLEQFCAHTAMARTLNKRIRDCSDDDELAGLLKMRSGETAAAHRLARGLRLTNQSRMRAETAGRAVANQRDASVAPPWAKTSKGEW